MKKCLLGLALVVLFGSMIVLSGCDSLVGPSETSTTSAVATTTTATGGTTTTTAAGGTTTTTSATTTTTSAGLGASGTAVGQSASASTALLLGVADIGSGIGDICGISGDPSQTFGSLSGGLYSSGIRAMSAVQVAAPPSFLLTREASWDGWLNVEGLHTGETVSLRFSTFNGDIIDGSIFGTKQIASLEGINWDDLASSTSLISSAEWSTAISYWTLHPAVYNTINSMWDYILWSSVLNNVHDNYAFADGGLHAAIPYIPSFHVLAIPTAEVGDMMGSFAGTVTREGSASNYGVDLLVVGTMEYNTSITPNHEVPTSLTGEGTVTLPSGLVVTLSNMRLGFETNVHDGVVPSNGTFIWDFTLSGEAWSGTTYINADRTGTGEVSRDGIVVGTMSLDAIGGAIVTIEGVTIPVTAAP